MKEQRRSTHHVKIVLCTCISRNHPTTKFLSKLVCNMVWQVSVSSDRTNVNRLLETLVQLLPISTRCVAVGLETRRFKKVIRSPELLKRAPSCRESYPQPTWLASTRCEIQPKVHWTMLQLCSFLSGWIRRAQDALFPTGQDGHGRIQLRPRRSRVQSDKNINLRKTICF